MAHRELYTETKRLLEEQARELRALFDSTHLPVHLRPIAREFEALADTVYTTPVANFQKVECLRNLLAAKDAAVRMKVLMHEAQNGT